MMKKTYKKPNIVAVPMEVGGALLDGSVFPGGNVHDEDSQDDWENDHSSDVPGAIPGGGWNEGDSDDAASKPNLWE